MQENEIVQKLSLLKEVKPKANWVLFAKNRIQEQAGRQEVGQVSLVGQMGHVLDAFRYLEKPAFVFAAVSFVVLGIGGYAVSQNSLPGDPLYSVKTTFEKTSMALGNDSLASLQVAQKRLADLRRVVEENKVQNLAVATQEFNSSVARVSESFKALVENEPAKALQASRELVQLQKDKAQLEQVLGASLGENETSELREAARYLAVTELKDLQTRTLNEEQEELLEQALRAYADSDYEKALELVWQITN